MSSKSDGMGASRRDDVANRLTSPIIELKSVETDTLASKRETTIETQWRPTHLNCSCEALKRLGTG